MSQTWYLCDIHLHLEAYRALVARGMRAVHVGEEGLGGSSARELLDYAIDDGCILITGNYADFSRLAELYRARGRPFPGVLFLPAAAGRAEQVAAIERWLDAAGRTTDAESEVIGRCAWLT